MSDVILTTYDYIIIGFMCLLLVCLIACALSSTACLRHRRWRGLSFRRTPDERNWQARDVREREMIRRS